MRTDIINYYLSKRSKPTYYLEIGVRDANSNFNKVNATHKDGVDIDPSAKCNFIMSSDEFFNINQTKYDIIFIDGNHIFEQVYLDVLHALSSLTLTGFVIMHDCNPFNELCQRVPLATNGPWTGTVWKAFVKLRMERENLGMFVIDDDYGVGVIDPNKSQKLFTYSNSIFDYEVFSKVKEQALNLISIKKWEEIR